jgi:hypothetical protein
MGEVTIITPVAAGQADGLNRYLGGLPRDTPPAPDAPATAPRSPFTGVLPPTHFARFVVIKLDAVAHLMFSSRFDGPVTDYLRALSATPQGLAIWSHCHVPSVPAGSELDRPRLERYLCDPRHHLAAQYVVSAFPTGVTVGQVNGALSLRDQLGGFVSRAGRLHPAALAHDFRQLPAIRQLLQRR